jgi:HEAT repeat protein
MMKTKVLIAHAKGEENLAEQLAEPIRAAGYEVAHEGTVLVGESLISEASRLLSEGVPVILCGTVRAVGTKWGRQVVSAARRHAGVRIFVVQMEEEADVDMVSFDEAIARYWQDSAKAEQDLVTALLKYYPPERNPQQNLRVHDLEYRYRELALKACDIIDLANLPEDDRHLASRELDMRRLYVALRMRLEIQAGNEVDDKTLEALEERRAMAWGGGRWQGDEEIRVSLGERLQAAKRLVVLGDPGAGKSTLLRWLATAYLLRLQNDPNWRDLPDIASLPDTAWLPILVRCRDLPQNANTLDDMLLHSLRKSESAEAECKELRDLLRAKLEAGTALLLVDGLDEITEPAARARFSQQLEQIHRVFPDAPIVVTSRIVGYREMGYRIRSGFEHLTVADLLKQDKDDFAHRWCALTEPADRRETAAEELIADIHSRDRIERLTGNPMLLTTMALIKRKIGRLPQRRVDLYEKAVEVLLNWRSAVDMPLDAREALPQLEYLAHAMCVDGIQQLREDQALELLRQVRVEYPQIHPLTQHTPEEFLSLLERRTGLLIQSGLTRHNGYTVSVYEFRHLTFQEYLAGLALVQGHYRGRDKHKSLAEAIAPLAGLVSEIEFGEFEEKDTAVVENWHEALRLCLAACNDDDVDGALLAILHPLPDESGTVRPRAVLAGLCLADEPNVSEAVAQEVLQTLVNQVAENDGRGGVHTSIDVAAMELTASRWADPLGEYLLDEFFRRETLQRESVGGLYADVQEWKAPLEEPEFATRLLELVARLLDGTEHEAAEIALTVMQLSYRGKNCQTPGMVDGLIQRLSGSAPMRYAAAWALMWLNRETHSEQTWYPNVEQLERLSVVVADPSCDSETVRFLSSIFEKVPTTEAVDVLLRHLSNNSAITRRRIVEALWAIGDPGATDALLARMQDAQEDQEIRLTAAKALGQIGETRAVASLMASLQDIDENMRYIALQGLACTWTNETDRCLLSSDLDGIEPWLDPLSPITPERITEAADKLEKTPEEIQQRYTALAERFGLKLA